MHKVSVSQQTSRDFLEGLFSLGKSQRMKTLNEKRR